MQAIVRKNQTGEPTANGGQFGSKHHSETEALLLHGSRTVQSVYGPIEVTPGVWDSGAIEAYSSGQCVAIAFAISQHEDLLSISAAATTDSDDHRIIHAWATVEETDDAMIDSAGRSETRDLFSEYDEAYGPDGWTIERFATTEEVQSSKLCAGLPKQDYETATLMVSAVPNLDGRDFERAWRTRTR